MMACSRMAQSATVADEVLDLAGHVVIPGLINTHHHLYQNLTRALPAMTDKPLFGWLQSLYPLWRRLDAESVHVSAWMGLAELALAGCTTSTDHLYLHPHGSGDLLGAEIDAAVAGQAVGGYGAPMRQALERLHGRPFDLSEIYTVYYAYLEKAAVLQEARCFNDSNVVRENPRKCCTVIAQLLHLQNTGQFLSSTEATEGE